MTHQKLIIGDKPQDIHWINLDEDDDEINAKLIPVNSTTDLVALEHRHQQICEIATNVKELAQMFTDLNGMIVADGNKLDIAATNIEHAKHQTEIAHVELVKANNLQQSNAILIGILITLVAGPSVGVLVGIKAGVLTALGTGSATALYDKLINKNIK